MGDVVKNREDVGLIHAWGRKTDHREIAAERVGQEMVYPSLEGAMKESVFKEIRTSITNRQNTVTQYIATRPLLDLSERTKQIGGARLSRRWWDQKGIDYFRIGDRNGREGGTEHSQWGGRIKWV